MGYVILGLFLGTILVTTIRDIIKYGWDEETFELILNDIYRLRAIFFILFFLWVCMEMMNKIDDNSKWVILPFAWCGVSCLLMMYKKTERIGYITFLLVFFGASAFAIFLGIYNSYIKHTGMDTHLIKGLLVIGYLLVLALIFVISNKVIKKDK